MRPNLVLAVLVAQTVALFLMGIALFVAFDKLERESVSIDQIRGVSARICAREAVDRAFGQTYVGRTVVIRDRLHDLLPILDCAPNLRGEPAVILPPRLQDDFARRWRQGRLRASEEGICRVGIDDNEALRC